MSTQISSDPQHLRAFAHQLSQQVPYRGPAESRGTRAVAVSGRVPSWLRGRVVRVAPSFACTPTWAPAHMFDGIATAYAVFIGDDGLSFRWAHVESNVARAAATGQVSFTHFGTPNQRGFWRRLIQPISKVTDNPNVNVVPVGDSIVALTETSHQVVLHPETLSTQGRLQYDDSIGPGAVMLAHPIMTRDTVTNLAVKFGPSSIVHLYEHASTSRARRVRARWKTKELPYLHSFGLTPRGAIIVSHPFRTRGAKLLWSNLGYIDHFEWNPKGATKLVILRTDGSGIEEYETDPMFVFHVVQAAESDGETVLDVLAHDDPSIIEQFATSRLVERGADFVAAFVRLRIDHRTGRVRREALCDERFEFPQIDQRALDSGPARLAFGVQTVNRVDGIASAVIRVDTATGQALRFEESGYVFGEPLFVGDPGAGRRGQGILLSFASSRKDSAMFVLDAETLDVRARVEIGVPVPIGFHGSFIPAA
jgi:beta,beta-carotene 9',10'-dioxygenase